MPTNPGFHPDVGLLGYPAQIRQACRKVAENFYVTREFKPISIGNSQYWAILVRPTDEFSIYVNTERELLILFSTYENFEIRTLEAYDEFYDLLESKRVDKSVRFLVSADEKIENTIKHYLDQHPEYPIIIPTTFIQITSQHGNQLLAAVRRNYLIRDLFGYQNPLREETLFFGRQEIVNSVLDMAKSGQNSSLFGLRKSGKTSAIYAIRRKARGFSCNVAVIDCQNPAVHARKYDDLLSYMIGEIRRACGQKPTTPDLGDTLPKVSDSFSQHMKSTLGAAKGSILLIFDEIENISPQTAASQHWREGSDTLYFWQVLRSFLQSETTGRVSICIVGTSPQILETARINGVDNPVYLYAQKRFIPNLSFDETRDMIVRLGYFMGLEFPPTLIAELHRDFGGHPFFTRQVCSKVHQLAAASRPIQVSRQALDRAKTEFFGQLETYLRDILGQLRTTYPEEFDVLSQIAFGNTETVSEYGREAPDLIDHLIGYGLIERVGEDFDIKLDAIKNALNHVLSREEGEDRWAEISRRRNKLEVEIRAALYHWSRGVSAEDWPSFIEENLTKTRREALLSTEPSSLFSKKQSPLYLSDLLMLLKDKNILPYLGDRRSIVSKDLDTINKLRKDAHANRVTDSEMNAARRAFDNLEAEFLPPE